MPPWKEVGHLFRKDCRRFWWAILLVLLGEAAQTWTDCRMPVHRAEILNSSATQIELLVSVMSVFLVGLAVLSERLTGDTAYWLTRPFSWKALLTEKLLFGVVWLSGPTLLGGVVALAVNGYSPLHYVPELAWRFAASASFVIAILALASVCANFVAFTLATIAAIGVVAIATMQTAVDQWGGLDWVRYAAVFAVLIGFGGVAAMWQYRRRATGLVRIVLGCGIVLLVVAISAGYWHAAFEVTAAAAREPDAARAIAVQFTATNGKPQRVEALHHAHVPPAVRVALPVHVTGIRPGTQLISERVRVAVSAPGAEWRSKWVDTNQVAAVDEWRNRSEWMAGDADYWLSMEVPSDWYDRWRNTEARVHADMAFTLATDPRTVEWRSEFNGRRVDGVGTCTLTAMPGTTLFGCVTPFWQRDLWEFSSNGQTASGCCLVNYGPVPDGVLWADIFPLFSRPQGEMKRIQIEMRTPLSHVERTLDVGRLRLADYFVSRHEARR